MMQNRINDNGVIKEVRVVQHVDKPAVLGGYIRHRRRAGCGGDYDLLHHLFHYGNFLDYGDFFDHLFFHNDRFSSGAPASDDAEQN